MAEIALKSIKFPGLANTYTIPQIDPTLTQSGQAADSKVVGDKIDEIKSDFVEKVDSRYGDVYSPNLIESDESMTFGYVAKNGSVSSSSVNRYTDYIPVRPGYVLRPFLTNMGVFTPKALRFVCCYDENKSPVSSAGSNTSVAAPFTVPDGIAFVRVTVDGAGSAASKFMLSVNCTPTEYTAYTELKSEIIENFLTNASEAFLTRLMTSGISASEVTNRYGCAIHRRKFRKTIGIPMTWYKSSIITPKTAYVGIGFGSGRYTAYNDKIVFTDPSAPGTSVNGYKFNMYDNLLGTVLRSDKDYASAGYGLGLAWVSENLSDCTLLAIGDSTVDHDAMTGTMLSHFTEQGHTLTLLGTLGDGSGTNKNEGRAGWKATDYLTDRQYKSVVNPFYNPSTQTFDFSYYMSNQGYTGVDFVVLQLGINDLYNSVETDTLYSSIWDAIKTMIDSILAYNSGIKIILNLPTAPNSDQSKHSVFLPLYQNRVVRYNDYAQEQARAYSTDNVRCSYCHMILDPDTEIRDNVHPTADGYAKMGMEVVNQINCWQNGV